MVGDVTCRTEITLGGDVYVAYLKEVATKTGKLRMPGTTTKAFIKKK